MPQVNINHAFVSSKPDSPDGSLISSSEWNSPLIVTGGSHSQMLVRDATSPTGVSVVAGPLIASANDTYAGAAPTPAMGTLSLIMSTASKVILFTNMAANVSDSSNAIGYIYRDGVIFSQFAFAGVGGAICQVASFEEAAGSHTYHVQSNLASGTFTLIVTTLVAFAIGTI